MQINTHPDYVPLTFPANARKDNEEFWLLNAQHNLEFHDLFEGQKKELFKVRSPKIRRSPAELDDMFVQWAQDRDLTMEGTWVYYPWTKRMVHILDEAEFVELRTSRNKHKITETEQSILAQKSIGVIGLSVGNAVAVTLAIERGCGHLKLADFDTLELSNLNRIRAGIHSIGLNKCVITAREIAEIDPYLNITCFTEGLDAHNIDAFIDGLDLLIDECDDIDMKILARQKAQYYQLPLIMETSDRGMLDIERYDLEPDRPIFHGMLQDIPPSLLQKVPTEHKMGLVMRILEAPKTSARGRASLLEMGQTLGTWPQLASAVAMGGGVVADVSRRVLLRQLSISGRFHVDLEGLIAEKEAPITGPSGRSVEAPAHRFAISALDGLPGDPKQPANQESFNSFLAQLNPEHADEPQSPLRVALPNGDLLTAQAVISGTYKNHTSEALAHLQTLLLLNPLGHQSFYATMQIPAGGGLPHFEEYNFPDQHLVAFSMLTDYRSAAVLQSIDGGQIFKDIFQGYYNQTEGYLALELPADLQQLALLIGQLNKIAAQVGYEVKPLLFPTQLSLDLRNKAGYLKDSEMAQIQEIENKFVASTSLNINFCDYIFLALLKKEGPLGSGPNNDHSPNVPPNKQASK